MCKKNKEKQQNNDRLQKTKCLSRMQNGDPQPFNNCQ